MDKDILFDADRMGGPERSSILHVPIQAKKGFQTTDNVRDLANRVVEVRRYVWICLNDLKALLRSVKTKRRETQSRSSLKTAMKYILSLEYQMLGFTNHLSNLSSRRFMHP